MNQEHGGEIFLPNPTLSMIIISWNVRGLNGPSKQRSLKTLISVEKPSMIMIQKTKCNSATLEK
jgi:exonuclease III